MLFFDEPAHILVVFIPDQGIDFMKTPQINFVEFLCELNSLCEIELVSESSIYPP